MFFKVFSLNINAFSDIRTGKLLAKVCSLNFDFSINLMLGVFLFLEKYNDARFHKHNFQTTNIWFTTISLNNLKVIELPASTFNFYNWTQTIS